MKKQLLTLFLPLLFFAAQTLAKTTLGADISYQCIDTLKYKVTIKYYRDCRGISFTNTTFNVRCSSSGSSLIVPLTLENIKEITPICDTVSGGCIPQNKPASEGIEQHTYTAILDFDSLPFNGLKGCTGKIILETQFCCRSSSINTGAGGKSFYTYAELDISKAPWNSSPVLSTEPISILCCNQPVYINIGASDTSDRDSLSYSWTNPLSNSGTIITYNGSNYSYQHPFTAYYPGSLKPPYYNINADPPIGIRLNPLTGDVIFTPTNCTEVTVAIIKVTEWRKDSSGIMRNIGVTHRDMQFIVKSCPDNNPPTIKGPYSYNVCVGDKLCFNVNTDDKVFVPTSGPVPALDTVTNTWNNGIPGATYTIINPTARLQTGQFCWTPEPGSVSSLPYYFTVTATDNACPLRARSSRGFSVRVKPRAKDSVSITEYFPGKFKVKAHIDSSTFQGNPSHQWTLLDTARNFISDSLVASFHSTNSFLSRLTTDTLQINRIGSYILKHDVNNLPVNCPATTYHLVVVDSLFETQIIYPNDTSICTGSPVTLQTITKFNIGSVAYQWYKNDTIQLIGDTLSAITFTENQSGSNNTYTIVSTDENGYSSIDKVRVHTWDNLTEIIEPSYKSCVGDTVLISLDTTISNVVWNTNSYGHSKQFTKDTTLSIVYVDSFLCTYQDSSIVSFWRLPDPSLRDSATCNDEMHISSNPFATYSWNTFDSTQHIHIDSSGLYTVQVKDTNGCVGFDSAYYTIHNAPEVSLGNDTTFCGDSLVLEANISGQYLWSSTEVSASIIAQNTGTYWLQVTDTNACTSRDSIEVNINPFPNLNLGNDTAFCGDSLLLVAIQGYNYTWSNGDTLSYSSINSSGDYWLQITDSNGCQSAADTIQITLHSNLATPVITQYGDSIGSSLTGKHIWFKDQNELVGEENNYLRITADASYSALSVDTNGCYSDTSNTLLANLSSRTLDHSRIKVYPNPSHGKLTIDLSLLSEVRSIYMLDALGRKVPVTQTKNGHLVQLEWNATAGILWLMIDAESGRYRKEIVYLK
ncbi:MAG: T9SS type A sorting domain-containing protein [Bacteroidia bacterium]